MSNKKLTILGIVAIVMLILAGLGRFGLRQQSTAISGQSYLIQGLDPAEIGSIILAGQGGETVTMVRRGTHFVVAEKDDYIAKTEEINGLINTCFDLKTDELITKNAVNHEDLGVTKATAGHAVKFMDKAGNPIIGFFLSDTTAEGNAYVRLTSSDDVYLMTVSPQLTASAVDLVDRDILSVEQDKIKNVTVTGPEGSYTLKRQDDGGEIVLDGEMPEGKQFKGSDYRSVFSALTNLRFDDVIREISKPLDLKFDATYMCKVEDGTVYTLAIGKVDDKTYISCDAMHADKTMVTKDRRVESEEELKDKEALLIARDNAKGFSTRHAGWVYEIAEYKAGHLTKTLSDLLEDVPDEEEEAGQEGGESGSAQ